MAQSKNNPLTKGLSGMIGNSVVFRTVNGKTIISNRPSKPKFQSALQKENRTKFSRAVAFSKRMMSDPIAKEKYGSIAKQEGLPNAYTAAVTEYMRKPEIQDIDIAQYTGGKDQEIRVRAEKKGFEVMEVEVLITDEKGQKIEQGKAGKATGGEWIYTSQVDTLTPMQLMIRVRDRVNNVVERRISLKRDTNKT
jgi:hypothetical protein